MSKMRGARGRTPRTRNAGDHEIWQTVRSGKLETAEWGLRVRELLGENIVELMFGIHIFGAQIKQGNK